MIQLFNLALMCIISVDGVWSPWSQWSGCGAGLCGGNKKLRTRSCTNPHPSGGGKRCPGNSFEEGGCPSMKIRICKCYAVELSVIPLCSGQFIKVDIQQLGISESKEAEKKQKKRKTRPGVFDESSTKERLT